MKSRRGISLIEVLFSIGIVGIGLLGVLLLVPLAMRNVGLGNENDRTARLGQNALAEFQIRGMGQMENLRSYHVPSSSFQPVTALGSQTSFAIDPLALSLTANQNAGGSVFPANGPLNMPRFSLRSIPHPLAPAMSSLQTDRLFILRDELVFSLPDDKTLPPVQIYNWSEGPDGAWGSAGVDDDGNGTVDDGSEAGAPGTDDVAVTRQNEGAFSWMATLTPKLDIRHATPFPDNVARDYTLSIVVFRNRDFSVTNGIAERTVDVATFYGDGTGGGDVLLRTQSTSTNAAEELQGIREGQWIMLACALPTFGAAGTVNYFAWYRVDGVDDEPLPNGSGFELDVSLGGPDWPLAGAIKPTNSSTGTFAVICSNVAGVYQKTIRLESSSLWSN